jgi:hypothetical protein
MKESRGGGEFKNDIFHTLQRTFANATMYPHLAQKQKTTTTHKKTGSCKEAGELSFHKDIGCQAAKHSLEG